MVSGSFSTRRLSDWPLAVVFAWLAVPVGLAVSADEQKPQPDGGLPTAEDVRERLKIVAADDGLSEEAKKAIQEAYNATLAALGRRDAAREQLTSLKAAADSAESRQQAAAAELKEPVDLGLPEVTATDGVDLLEEAKQAAGQLLASETRRLASLKATITERRQEAKTLPEQVVALEEKLTTLRQPPPEDPEAESVVTMARGVAHQAERVATEVELAVARQKLVTYERESKVLPAEQEQLERRVAAATEAVSRLARLTSRKRQDVIATRVDEFEERLDSADEARRRGSAVTVGLLDRWADMAKETRRFGGELVETRERATALRADLDETTSLVNNDLASGSGLSRSVGYLLRRKRATLPGEADLSAKDAEQSAAVELTQEMLARIDGRLDELASPEEPRQDGDKPASLDQMERELLQSMDSDAERLLTETLIPLGVQQKTLQAVVRDFRILIDRHLLWVRSDAAFSPAVLVEAAHGVGMLLHPDQLRSVALSLSGSIAARPGLAVGGLVALGILILLRRWIGGQIVQLGGTVGSSGALRMRPTIEAMLLTAVAAIPAWLAVWLPARLLSVIGKEETATAVTAEALATVATMLLPLEFLRQFARPHGIAADHFGWSAGVLSAIRLAVWRAIVLAIPLVFLWRLFDEASSSHDEIAAAGNLFFVLLMVVAAVILWRLAHPVHGVAAAMAAGWGLGSSGRLAWIWRPLAVAVPLSLAGLALAGYGYSAGQLSTCFYRSIWVVIVATVLHGLAVRWLLISRRRIALAQMKERAAAREQAEAAGAAAEILDLNRLDVGTINQQSRRLIDATLFVAALVGIYWIWSPVLPALALFDNVVLWQVRSADGTVTGAVTLANLLVAVPILVLTFISVRNAPGLLEAALLRHLPLDHAARYAVTSLTSYILAGLGLVLAAGTLGLSWGSVQWLVAGLSVGLGFGLQEIVANFVCGIILLFEQPIRVGDVVTLDGFSGVVSRIRIRATTVTTWDRQEYIVPNKDLITGRVINWTLSDSVNRVDLPVGVAYGSDTRRATKLLREICESNSHVLTDPSPLITFEEFADSSLKIMLRFYLGSLDNRLDAIHEMHTAIHERFAEEGIEIAFPQLDLHFRNPMPS